MQALYATQLAVVDGLLAVLDVETCGFVSAGGSDVPMLATDGLEALPHALARRTKAPIPVTAAMRAFMASSSSRVWGCFRVSSSERSTDL
jgi:hypothetical protein